MLSLVRERRAELFRPHSDRQWSLAFAASAAVHVGVLLLLGWLWIARPHAAARVAALDSRWQTDDRQPTLIHIERPLASVAVETTNGGREAPALAPPSAELDSPRLFPPPAPLMAAEHTDDRTGEKILREGLALEVGAAPSGPASSGGGDDAGTGGRGTGAGLGEGPGRGRFFGAPGNGRRFVYVVDRSASMNQAHASQWKTRFRRLKVELLNSIGRMTPEMEFYIVFFNQHAEPMPASGLQPATNQAKQKFLDWMARIRAGGETDPRAALAAALHLRPDTIYFLSDGAFPDHVAAELKNLRQRTVVIHTFALGDAAGRRTLEQVAAQNGGQFHFVP